MPRLTLLAFFFGVSLLCLLARAERPAQASLLRVERYANAVEEADREGATHEMQNRKTNPYVHNYYFFNVPWGPEDYAKAGIAYRADNGGGQCTPTDTNLPKNETKKCEHGGKCVEKGNGTFVCECDEEYAGSFCEDSRKSKLTAFLLSLFLGAYGADRFYLEYYLLGGLKLALALVGICGGCIYCCGRIVCASIFSSSNDGYQSLNSDESGSAILGGLCSLVWCCFNLLVSCGMLAWWLTDLILILTNNLNDNNGYALYNNM